jgi:hypothetical protein
MAVKINNVTVIDDNRKMFPSWVTGSYSNFHPKTVHTITTSIDMEKPLMKLAMSGNVTFTITNEQSAATCTLFLDTSTSGHTPTFPSSVKFGTTPTWSASRHWHITMTCTQSSTGDVRASAIGFDEPTTASSSFSNFTMGGGAGFTASSYGTTGNPWAAVSLNFIHQSANNRVKITHGNGNSISGTTETTYYANYTGLTGITSVEAQYNVGSQSCTGGNTNSANGYSYGPLPTNDGYNSGTYYTVPTSGGLFLGWQSVSTSANQSQSTYTSASFNSANPDIRIKIVCTQGTFYSTSEVGIGTISCQTNWGSMPDAGGI